MLDVLRFWLDKGVDGFRVDVAARVMKDPELKDNPPNPYWREGLDPATRHVERFNHNTCESHKFNRWLRSTMDEYTDKVIIGEFGLPLPELVTHYGYGDEFHLPFNFRLIFTTWKANKVKAIVNRYENLLPENAWPNWVLGNHDQSRIASRVGEAQQKVAMMLLLTLRGTPTLYYGDEIGMQDVSIPPKNVRDPWEKKVPGLRLGRDPERTPLQWDDSPNAGFCPGNIDPWLPIGHNFAEVNILRQRQHSNSMLTLTQKLTHLRSKSSALKTGNYNSYESPRGIFAYTRWSEEDQYLIVLNFTNDSEQWVLPEEIASCRIMLSTYLDQFDNKPGEKLYIRPNEGLILAVNEFQ